MKTWFRSALALFIILSALFGSTLFIGTATGATTVTVKPMEDAKSILTNPGVGFQSHSASASYFPSKTGYIRATSNCISNGKVVSCGPLNWDRLNPAKGIYNFADIDLFLRNMKDQKKVAGLRIRNVEGPGSAPKVPTWAAAAGVTTSLGQEAFGGPKYPEIDYHKCTFLDLWDDVITEMVKRYDTHPQVAFIDIGGYGYYGEWFSGKTVLARYPTDQVYDPTDPTYPQSYDTRLRIVRMFTGGAGSGKCVGNDGKEKVVAYSYAGFKNKPVLISRGDHEDVAIGVTNKAGIRFDAVGTADGKMDTFRKQAGPSVEQIWRTKPIMGEFAPNSSAANHASPEFVSRSLCFAREFHLSGIQDNLSSAPKIDYSPLWREIGYRLVLTQATYPTSAAANSKITVNFSWVNKGTAPAYTKYPLHIYFKPVGQPNVVSGWLKTATTDITKILPANVTVKDPKFLNCPKGALPAYNVAETFTVPNMPAGQYEIWFGFVDPTYGKLIQLGMAQRDITGRTLLGKITVSAAAKAPVFQPKP